MLKADDTTRSKYYNHKLDKFLDIFCNTHLLCDAP